MVIKHLLAVLAIFTASLALQPAAAATFESGGLRFTTATDGSNNVSLAGGTVDNGELVIPASVSYDGVDYTVNAIAWWSFQSRTDIRRITMPDCISSIGSSAFVNCSSLETVVWSKGLKSIGQFAFSGCSSLLTAILPEGLESIGADGFASCAAMTEISLPQTLTTIGEAAFAACDNLTSIDIPSGIKTISKSMISGKKLTHIGLPEGLTRIESMGISVCFALKELSLPRSIESLAENALFRCDSLDVVYAPWARPIQIGDRALDDATIHVPVNTASYYREARNWNLYRFVEDPALGAYYTYSVATPENGSIRLEQGGSVIADDYFSNAEPLVIIAEPEEGYELKELKVNGTDVTASVTGNSYTIAKPAADITVEARFGISDKVWLTVRQAEGGETRLKVARDMPVELAISTDEGWKLHSVSLNGVDLTDQVETDGNLLSLPPLGGPAVLNIAFEKTSSAITGTLADSDMRVSARDGELRVSGLDDDAVVAVYTTSGSRVAMQKTTGGEATFTGLPRGIYIVTDGHMTVKTAL